jgi:hypothetical protein
VGFPVERRRTYDLPPIREWLVVFVKRFFAFSQFKRSAMPNGPKVSAGGSLSPRGDWRAPSDGNAEVWLADIAKNIRSERRFARPSKNGAPSTVRSTPPSRSKPANRPSPPQTRYPPTSTRP